MTDSEITNLVAHALQQEGSAGLPALTALRDRVQAERGPLGPALGPVWDALVEVTSRRHEDLDALLQLSEQRARWLASVRGPADPATIRAWVELGFAAEDEYFEPLATRAWEAVAAAPIDIDALPADVLPLVSQALRGLAGSRRGAGALDEARRLFERDLALNEKIAPGGSPQLALSLQNLAALLERRGERAQALALRRRQRDTLVATAASHDLLAAVDEAIARLAAP
jgi:hypothetical protein